MDRSPMEIFPAKIITLRWRSLGVTKELNTIAFNDYKLYDDLNNY